MDIVRTRRSNTPAATPGTGAGDLSDGQIAVNLADRKIWIGASDGTPILIYDSSALVVHGLTDHSDTDTPDNAGRPNGYILTWDLGNQKWEAKPQTGLTEFGALADHVSDNDIWEDFNVMDWTGHQQASGTSLSILDSSSVTCGNGSGIAYLWVGPKNVTVGVGGSHTCVESDFLAVGAGDHTVLTNIGTNTHAQLDSHLADTVIHQPQFVHDTFTPRSPTLSVASVLAVLETNGEGHVTNATSRTLTAANLGVEPGVDVAIHNHAHDDVDESAIDCGTFT